MTARMTHAPSGHEPAKALCALGGGTLRLQCCDRHDAARRLERRDGSLGHALINLPEAGEGNERPHLGNGDYQSFHL